MVNFCSCSHDTFKMSNKLINESYKVFCLVDLGYIFDFCFILCNRKIPGVEDTDNLIKPLFKQTMNGLLLSPNGNFCQSKCHPTLVIDVSNHMDNYFSNVSLFLKLKMFRIGACRTVRQNCSSFPKELKVEKTLTGS